MILASTLRRRFILRGSLPDDCVSFLRTDPSLPAPAERTDLVEVTRRNDGLYRMSRCGGSPLIGSARALTLSLDHTIFRLAASDEGATLSVNASTLRLFRSRLLVIGDKSAGLGEITVALMLRGAAFEGTGLAFIRADGVVAHPAKPRLKPTRLTAVGSPQRLGDPPALEVNENEVSCAIDPRAVGADWSMIEGPVNVILFTERNDGGRSGIMHLRSDLALARLMQSIRSEQKPDARAFVRLHAMIQKAHCLRFSIGDPRAAAELLATQLPRIG